MATNGGNDAASGLSTNGNVVVLDGEPEEVEPAPASVFQDQDKVESHPAFGVLKGKKHFKLAEKQALLKPFRSIKPETVFEKSMLDYGSPVRKCLANLKMSGKTESGIKKNWNASYCAEYMVRLFQLVEESESIKATRRSSDRARGGVDKAVRDLKKAVNEAVKHAQVEASVKSTKQKRSVFVTQKGQRVQETVKFQPNLADAEPCALCGHSVCMPVDDAKIIDGKNLTIQEENQLKAAQWESRSTDPSKRGPKPNKKPSVTQRIGCYCFGMNCLCKQSGEGCVMCVAMKGLSQPFLAQDGVGNLVCKCDVCKCKCSALYPRNKRQQAAIEAEEIKRGLQEDQRGELILCLHFVIFTQVSHVNNMHLPTGHSITANDVQQHFQSIMNNATIMAHQLSSSGRASDIEQDAFALASNLAMRDSSLQGNTRARNAFQLAMGPKPKVSNDGKTMEQLRQEKRQRRKAAEARAPPPVPSELVVSILGQKDSRFSRNGLSTEKLDPRSMYETPSSETPSSGSCMFPSFGASLAASRQSQPAQVSGSESHIDVVDLCQAENTPPSSETSDPVQERKKRMRRATGDELFQAQLDEKTPEKSTKDLHHLLLNATPRKTVDTTIGDAISNGYDTPKTMKYIKFIHLSE